MLSENDQIVFDEKSIDDTMINYFVNTTNKLKFKSMQNETKPLNLKSTGKVQIPPNLKMNDEINISLSNLPCLKKYLKIYIPKRMKR